MSNNSLTGLIYQALRNNDNQKRKQAQKLLVDYRSSNPNEFFIQCSELLANDDSQQMFIRTAAGTLLVSSAKLRSNNPPCIYLWDTLSQNVRQQVKQNMLATLINSNPAIMRAGANVIAHIAVIQVPRKEWMQIVGILAENTMHENVNIRRASTITIGYMCQVFNEAGVVIDQGSCQLFLTGIIAGSKQVNDKEIMEYSIKAMRDSLVFLRPILRQERLRNDVFNILMLYIKNIPQQNTAYQALYQFSKACYPYLNTYLQPMMEMAINHLQAKKEITVSALQLIDSIGCEYLQRVQEAQVRMNNMNANIPNYLTPIQSNLLPQIMRCFLIETSQDLQFSQLRNSAAKTLSTLVLTGDRNTVDTIAQGAATCLKSNELGHQQASAVLLSTLCEYQDKDLIEQILADALEPMMGLLNSQTDIVILNTLNGLTTIAEFYPTVFHNNSHLRDLLQKLYEFFDYNNSSVVDSTFNLLKNMTQKMGNQCLIVTEPALLLIKIVNFFQKCIDGYDQGSNKDLMQRAVVIIMNCLIGNKSREVLLQMVDFLMGKYYNFSNRKCSDQDIKINAILAVLHTTVLALEGVVPREGLVSRLIKLINDHIGKVGVEEQGLNLISSMAVTFGMAFQSQADYYWKVLLQGLDMLNQPRTFKSALLGIGDFSRIYGPQFLNRQIEVLNRLLYLIHDNLPKEVKVQILACLADVLIGIGPCTQTHLNELIKTIDICFQAVYDLPNNPNNRESDQQLKKAIIDVYACIVFAIFNGNNNIPKIQQLIEHFPFIATFIVRTCDKALNPTIEYVKTCLYILYDTYSMYTRINNRSRQHSQNVQNILDSQPIRNLVEMITKCKNRQEFSDLYDLFELIDSRRVLKNK